MSGNQNQKKSLNTLYSEYAALRGRENVEVALKTKQMEISARFFEIKAESWLRGQATQQKEEYTGDTAEEMERNAFIVENTQKHSSPENSTNANAPYPYGLELSVTVRDCLKSFSGPPDDFEKYLNGALKKKIVSAAEMESLENKNQGMKVPQKDFRTVKNTYRYLKQQNSQVDDDVLVGKVAEFLEMKEAKVRALLQYASDSGAVLCNLPEECSCEVSEKKREELVKEFRRVQTEWEKKKKRELISKLYTRDLIEEIGCIDLLNELSEAFGFLDKEIIELYISGKSITQKEIGERYGETEDNTSHILTRFKEKFDP